MKIQKKKNIGLIFILLCLTLLITINVNAEGNTIVNGEAYGETQVKGKLNPIATEETEESVPVVDKEEPKPKPPTTIETQGYLPKTGEKSNHFLLSAIGSIVILCLISSFYYINKKKSGEH